MKDAIKGLAPQVYKQPLRVTPRGFVALAITIVVAFVFFSVFGTGIPDGFSEFIALLMGYLGARTLKQ